MVNLDNQLVSRAKAAIVDRESSHRVRELILAYQLAVDFHNRQWGRHVIYDDRYERELRGLVIKAAPAKGQLKRG